MHGALWSGETRVSSIGSAVPLTRTSPTAIVAIRDTDVPLIRAADR